MGADVIAHHTGLVVSSGITGAKTTTMAVGGAYEHFVEPSDEASVVELIKILRREGQVYRVLGGGSNVIVADEGLPGWTIRLSRAFRICEPRSDGLFWVGAGMPLMMLSRDLSTVGFSGLEFAGGIPAWFGGAVRMNAGAHGGQIADIVERVRCVTAEGQLEEISKAELVWSYRRSQFQDGSVVLGALIRLTSGDRAQIEARRAHHLKERKLRQPLHYASSGSIFKNPGNDGMTAGAILERCSMKGVWQGEAQVSEQHANWIVNPRKQASAKDVELLIEQCKTVAKAKEGISLEREVIKWGADGPLLHR